jgi:hypothetical protein
MRSWLVTRTSALTNPCAHDPLLSVKALLSEFTSELRGVVPAFLQALLQVMCVGLH